MPRSHPLILAAVPLVLIACALHSQPDAAASLPGGCQPALEETRAGGLYFVLGPGGRRAGEFAVIGVLDASFRWIKGLTT